MGVWYTNGSPNLGQTTRFYKKKKRKEKEKRTCKILDFAVPVNHRVKLKENEKKDKYLGLVRDLKKLWHMKVTIIPIVIGAFGTVTKGLLNELEDLEVGGRVETIQITSSLRTARILRRVLETWGDLRRLAVTQTPVEHHQLTLMWKNSQDVNNDNNDNNNIVVRALGTITKVLINRLEDLNIRWRIEAIQTTSLVRSATILRRVLET